MDRSLAITCYSPCQIIGGLDLRLLVLNKTDLAVPLASRRRRRWQKLKIFLQ